MSLGQGIQEPPGPGRGIGMGRRLLQVDDVRFRVDRSDLHAQAPAPVAGQDGTGGRGEIGPHFATGGADAQGAQSGHEHLGGQILGVGVVPHLDVHQAIEPDHVVAVDRVPVGVPVVADHGPSRQPILLPG